MTKIEWDGYKKTLLTLKAQIINSGALKAPADLHVAAEDLSDETDLASSVINQTVTFNIINRELEKLRLIDEALRRIEDGTYGKCEECETPIGEKRLRTQPWTTLCITHAEERERETKKFSKIS